MHLSRAGCVLVFPFEAAVCHVREKAKGGVEDGEEEF